MQFDSRDFLCDLFNLMNEKTYLQYLNLHLCYQTAVLEDASQRHHHPEELPRLQRQEEVPADGHGIHADAGTVHQIGDQLFMFSSEELHVGLQTN